MVRVRAKVSVGVELSLTRRARQNLVKVVLYDCMIKVVLHFNSTPLRPVLRSLSPRYDVRSVRRRPTLGHRLEAACHPLGLGLAPDFCRALSQNWLLVRPSPTQMCYEETAV